MGKMHVRRQGKLFKTLLGKISDRDENEIRPWSQRHAHVVKMQKFITSPNWLKMCKMHARRQGKLFKTHLGKMSHFGNH